MKFKLKCMAADNSNFIEPILPTTLKEILWPPLVTEPQISTNWWSVTALECCSQLVPIESETMREMNEMKERSSNVTQWTLNLDDSAKINKAWLKSITEFQSELREILWEILWEMLWEMLWEIPHTYLQTIFEDNCQNMQFI